MILDIILALNLEITKLLSLICESLNRRSASLPDGSYNFGTLIMKSSKLKEKETHSSKTQTK